MTNLAKWNIRFFYFVGKKKKKKETDGIYYRPKKKNLFFIFFSKCLFIISPFALGIPTRHSQHMTASNRLQLWEQDKLFRNSTQHSVRVLCRQRKKRHRDFIICYSSHVIYSSCSCGCCHPMGFFFFLLLLSGTYSFVLGSLLVI